MRLRSQYVQRTPKPRHRIRRPRTSPSTPTRPRSCTERREEDRLAFWAKQANRLSWATPFTEVLDWSEAPFAKWFVGGKLNVAYNCVDRHVEAGHGDRVAIHWEGEPVGESRSLTYSDLLAEVSRGRQRADRPRGGRR